MRVSVVMATYNGSTYLLDQLHSILQGTRPPDELVVIDDASTDDTVSLVEHVLLKVPDTTLVLIRNDRNLGASASFAKGIGYSTGDLILFADQDDVWLSGKIATMEKCFQDAPDLCMAYSDGLITDHSGVTDGRTIFGTRNKAALRSGTSRDPMEVAMNPDIKGCTMAVNGPFARNLFAHTPIGFDKYWGHDHWIALFAYGTGRIMAIHEPLLWHRFHGGNASASVRFSPFRVGHWQRYLRTARQQGADHYVRRYRLVLEYIDTWSMDFSSELHRAVERCLAISERREALHRLWFLARLKQGIALYREGIYDRYYNGIFTLMRDLFL